MRKIAVISIVTLGTMLAGICSAQVSNFPTPPPLPTPVKDTPPPQPAGGNSPEAAPAAPIAPISPIAPPEPEPEPGPANSNATTGNQEATAPPADLTPSMSPLPDDSAASAIPISAATLNSMSALDDKNTLHPGDRISFRVIEDRDAAIPRMVTDTGEVDFPYVGRIKVEGLTCHQVAVQLKKLLEVDYYKSATVIVGLDVMASREQQQIVPHDVVWLIGQVRSVGPQEILPHQPMTVSQVILRAGGFGDFADQRRVRVVHRASLTSTNAAPTADEGDRKGQIIDVKAVLDGHPGPDPIVQPNDYIIVPKKFINL